MSVEPHAFPFRHVAYELGGVRTVLGRLLRAMGQQRVSQVLRHGLQDGFPVIERRRPQDLRVQRLHLPYDLLVQIRVA